MSMWFWVSVVLAGLLISGGVIFYIYIQRLLELDELFEYLRGDVEVNVSYFEKLMATPLFNDSQEVKTAHGNMRVMLVRMDEYRKRITEATGRTVQVESGGEKGGQVL